MAKRPSSSDQWWTLTRRDFMKVAGIGAAVASFLIAPFAGGHQRKHAKRPAPRYQPTMRRVGNGHDKRVMGPGHFSHRKANEGRPQPRH